MKRITQLLAFLFIGGSVFSQQQLHDGIYLVDKYSNSKYASLLPNRAVVQFNAGFVNEDPENYSPLIIQTENYFSFAQAGYPYVQTENNKNGILFLQLNEAAKEKLKTFTTRNLMKDIAVVINDQVLVLYKITEPVTGGLIKITKCDGQACKQILKNIKAPAKI